MHNRRKRSSFSESVARNKLKTTYHSPKNSLKTGKIGGRRPAENKADPVAAGAGRSRGAGVLLASDGRSWLAGMLALERRGGNVASTVAAGLV